MTVKAGPVVAALRRELRVLAERDPVLAVGARAEAALSLARALDDPGTSATARANCERALSAALDRLYELAPVAVAGDGTDALRARAGLKLAKPRPREEDLPTIEDIEGILNQ